MCEVPNSMNKIEDIEPQEVIDSRIAEAAKYLFDNRLGWSENRNPYAPRKFWADLSAALYGEHDLKTKELRR